MRKMFKKISDSIHNNKPLMFIYGFLKTILAIVLILILLVILVQRFSNNKFSIAGIRLYCVQSSSMNPDYVIGDILITKEVDADELKAGDNVTYLGKADGVNGIVITHKIQSVREENGKYYYITKGVANEAEDPEIEYSQIYGKVIYKTEVLSYISKKSTSVIVFILVIIIGLLTSISIVKQIFQEMNDEIEEEFKDEEKDKIEDASDEEDKDDANEEEKED